MSTGFVKPAIVRGSRLGYCLRLRQVRMIGIVRGASSIKRSGGGRQDGAFGEKRVGRRDAAQAGVSAMNAENSAERRAKLTARFAAQARFAEANSPLYHRLFGLIGRRLAEDEAFAARLLAAAHDRASYDIPLLTTAALHVQVLRRPPGATALAAYYPSAGGTADPAAPAFRDALFAALDALWDDIAAFIATRPVQTNEIARGLCWTLPLALTGWDAAHLVELGASAGLNLAADAWTYRIAAPDGAVRIGTGEPVCEALADAPVPTPGTLPRILTRHGCDLAPVDLTQPDEADYLAAFVWADQTERLRHLRAGILAFLRARSGPAPVQLAACRLPDELPDYLHSLPPLTAPCVIVNTYIGMYLPDRGRSLDPHIEDWAQAQNHPVLRLQWEHPHSAGIDAKPPHFGWLAWTADLWQGGRHRSWLLAWTHPHGRRIQPLPGLAEWRDFWRNPAPCPDFP